MAMAVDDLASSSNLLIKTSLEFENSIKNRLAWTKKQWSASGEAFSRVNKLCNSMNFWRNKLKPALVDSSFIITIFNTENDVKTELLQIISAIEELEPNIEVRGFSDFRNPRYLCIYFANKNEKNLIMEKFRMLENNFVVYLSWALEARNNVTTLKVHWIPINIDMEEIKKALSKYVKCIEEERYNLQLMSGRDMPSGKACFKVTINEGYIPETIPHLLNIANMEALITVAGRAPLCLNCDTLGHVSKKCRLRYCGFCKALKLKEHECITVPDKLSYAEVLKDGEETDDRIDPDDWGAAITKSASIVELEKVVISEKIIALERKIGEIDSKGEGQNFPNVNKKRSADGILVQSFSSSQTSSVDLESSIDEEGVLDGSASQVGASLECEKGSETLMNIEIDNKSSVLNVKVDKVKTEKTRSQAPKNKKKALSAVDQGVSSANNAMVTRSYGKPVINSPRKIKENQKLEKLRQVQEFVFKD